jgi:TRAP-type mannitol/chloroaromatic compound transport system substrate-binding protein
MPGGELYTALESGAIDATEWVGPYNDLAFGLYKAAKYYYYPGFHEPGTVLEAMINKGAFEKLPADLQSIVMTACKAVNMDLLSEYTARNPRALKDLVEKHGTDLRSYPADVLQQLRKISGEVVAEVAAKDPFSQKVYDSYKGFMQEARSWSGISEQAFMQARDQA